MLRQWPQACPAWFPPPHAPTCWELWNLVYSFCCVGPISLNRLPLRKNYRTLSIPFGTPYSALAQIYMTVAREAVEYCRDRLQWISPASVISARRE